MKFAAIACLGAVSAHELKDTKTDAVQLVEGFLLGAIDAEGFTDIQSCIKDVEHIVTDGENAYKDFKSKDIKDVIEGLAQVGDALKTIKTGMADCSTIKGDWAKLELIAKNFSSPKAIIWHLGKDITVNRVAITHEIDGALADYESKNWKDFGYQLGKAAAQVLLGEESPDFVKDEQSLYLY